jgi:hypothetical protein
MYAPHADGDLVEEDEHAHEHPELDNGLERLFSTVLPNHPTVTEEIRLADCNDRWVERFVDSFPAVRPQPLRRLRIDAFDNAPACKAAVAHMIRRNVPVQELTLSASYYAPLDLEGFKPICDSVAENQHVRILGLYQATKYNKESPEDTFARMLGPGSRIVELDTSIMLSEAGYASMIATLRSNETLETLVFRGGRFPQACDGLLVDLLWHHNCTLRRVWITHDTYPRQLHIDDLLRRNAHLRAAAEQLGARQFHVGPMALWPRAMARVGRMPHLLFQFLRKGSVDAFAKHMLEQPPPIARLNAASEAVAWSADRDKRAFLIRLIEGVMEDVVRDANDRPAAVLAFYQWVWATFEGFQRRFAPMAERIAVQQALIDAAPSLSRLLAALPDTPQGQGDAEEVGVGGQAAARAADVPAAERSLGSDADEAEVGNHRKRARRGD